MDKLIKTIEMLCERPGLYVGASRLRLVRAFLDGYSYALEQEGTISEYAFAGFLNWLQHKTKIIGAGYGWDRILVHMCGSEQAALQQLPTLFGQYRKELEAGTFVVSDVSLGEGIDAPEVTNADAQKYSDF